MTPPEPTTGRSSLRRNILLLVGGVIALDVAAFFFIPPFPKDQPGRSVTGIVDLIQANLEFPAPNVVLPPGHESPNAMVFFDVSITSTLLTMWLVMAVIVIVA